MPQLFDKVLWQYQRVFRGFIGDEPDAYYCCNKIIHYARSKQRWGLSMDQEGINAIVQTHSPE